MTARVVVAGLGPAHPELITTEVREAIDRIGHRYLRTERHPAASAVPGATSFDAFYERATTLEEVYATIVDELVSEAARWGEVLYLVPGSPTVAETSVDLLRGDARVDVVLLPGLSFLDLAWSRLGVDPLSAGVRLVDGHRFSVEAAGERGPLLVAQCDSRPVLSEVKLAVEELGPTVTVLQRLGLPDERVEQVAWADLDRSVDPDHLTSLWIPSLAAPVAQELARFAELVHTLRERCPWDREQTHQSLTRHLLEEAYETLEAVDALEPAAAEPGASGYHHLCEELGDLLFTVVNVARHLGVDPEAALRGAASKFRDRCMEVERRATERGTEVSAMGLDELDAMWNRVKRDA